MENLPEKKYKYDAFISYRHSDLDSFVAENIHKYLETYKLPKNVQNKISSDEKSIKRIFRDQDELPLSSNLETPIVDALNSSRYLIVICSPRLKESMWCKKEIETFKKIRGRENIFCVLIEGEPSESFPEEVLYDFKTDKDSKGKSKKVKEYYEPLAADVRGENKKEIIKKIKTERLRLIAPMFNLDYDDLKQRHRQRKIRKTIFTLSMIAIASFVLAIYSGFMFLKIFNQQKTLKIHQASSLTKESIDYLSIDDRYNAIKSSYESLTKFNGVKMPYTTDAEYQLCESLNVYNAGLSYVATNQIKTKGVIDYVKTSNDFKYILSYDESEELSLFNSSNFKLLKTFNDINGFFFNESLFTFVGNDKLSYINKDGNIVIYDINKNTTNTIEKEKLSYQSLSASNNGKYIVYHDDKYIYLYDVENKNTVNKVKTEKEIQDFIKFSEDDEYIIAASNHSAMDVFDGKSEKIYIFNVNEFESYKSVEVKADYLENVVFNNSIAYALLNNSDGIDKNNIVLIAFNYKTGDVKFTKVIDDAWGKSISKKIDDKYQSIVISHGNELIAFDSSNGKIVNTFPLKDDVIDIYNVMDSGIYLVFQENGLVNFINLNGMSNIIYNNLFMFNAGNYILVDKTNKGYILVPKNSNRIILYERNKSSDIKEATGNYEILTNRSENVTKYEEIKKAFNIDKKNMVNSIVYNTDKTLLFVSYVDSTMNIYDVETKKLINSVKDITTVTNYIGKDKYGRTYVGNLNDSYILDKEYNKVGHIRNLNAIDNKNNRVIIYDSDKYYSLPIYTLEDMLKIAKDYLKK